MIINYHVRYKYYIAIAFNLLVCVSYVIISILYTLVLYARTMI